jgi:hypothetical protein
MTLATCRECGKEISTQAPSCPHCGAPRPADHGWKGWGFEWKSERTCWGYPLVHIAFGKDARGTWRVAKGVIAIGQFAIGAITVAQFGVGLLFGFGQFIFGLTALAQFAGAIVFGVGQLASGYVAIGQVVFGYYGLAQTGWAEFLWSPKRKDPEAVAFFQYMWESVKHYLSW